MPERFMCDFVYHQDHRIDMTEVLCQDSWEAYEWLEETFLELHRDRDDKPDLLRSRKDDDILATWETHFDAMS